MQSTAGLLTENNKPFRWNSAPVIPDPGCRLKMPIPFATFSCHGLVGVRFAMENNYSRVVGYYSFPSEYKGERFYAVSLETLAPTVGPIR